MNTLWIFWTAALFHLREMYELLHRYPLMGDFMSYQTAIDLNYSDLIDFSEDEFTQAGPGAPRGIKKVFRKSRRLHRR